MNETETKIIKNDKKMQFDFRQFAQTSPYALGALDDEHQLIYCNKPFKRLLQVTDATGIDEVRTCLEKSSFWPVLNRHIHTASKQGGNDELQFEVKIDGREYQLLCRVVIDAGASGTPVIIELRDETEHQRLKHELIVGRTTQRQEEYLKQRRHRLFFGLLDKLPTFVYMQRRDYTVAYANDKVRELYGESEGRLCYEVFAGRDEPCLQCPTFEVFETGRPVEWEFTDSNDRTFLIYDYPYEDDTGEPLVMEMGVDITNLKQVEKELFKAQKLRAIGVLAGGIAHDLNNNLVPIIFNTEYALNKTGESQLSEPLRESLQAARRAAELVEQVLEYSRLQDVTRLGIHIIPLIEDYMRELRANLPDSIDLRFDARVSNDLISANTAQMRQLLLNLVKNAEQSMPEGGSITISLLDGEPGKRYGTGQHKLIREPHLVIGVSDTGIGIRPERQDQIFEPFFTTKKARGGTGMGLAVVESIVTGNRGAITVDSTPGIGTTFSIYMPLAEGIKEDVQEECGLAKGGNNAVLLVDDEQSGVSAMKRVLEDAGFSVDTALSGEEGLALFEETPEKFSLVLADQSMTGMSGLELSAKLLGIKQNIPVVICTGHIEPALEEKALQEGVAGFVRKPASPKTLVEMVRRHCG